MVSISAPRTFVPARPPATGLRDFAPNWYATVMGTSIVANAGAALPDCPPWLRDAATAVWAVAALWLVAVLVLRTAHWARHRDQAGRHLLDPDVAPFYGCLPMALLAVGAGALSVGGRLVGARVATGIDVVLWTAGTVSALVVAAAVPYLMVARHRIGRDEASPVWLLPIVAPMVAAATGPALVRHLPAGAGQAREAMVVGCTAMFGMSLLATLMILPLMWGRLVRAELPVALTPTLFLVLGPLGQSTTAVGSIADAVPATPAGHLYTTAFNGFCLLYGIPIMGFAVLWLATSLALVVRAARGGMRFSMAWWAFTFPVGTCVTGAAALSRHTGLHALTWLAVGLYVLLTAAWLTAGSCTVRDQLAGRFAPRVAV